MQSGAMPEVSRSIKQRIIKLRDLLTLGSDGEIYLYTRTPPPEMTTNDGTPLLSMKAPLKLRVVSPDNIKGIIEEIYRAPNLGSFRGVSALY